MLTRSFHVGLIAALLSASVLAKPTPRMVQSRYNAQIQVQDMATLSPALDALCRECQGQITNFNCNTEGGNGNLNVRVPEDKLERFTEGLRRLGALRNENRSTSDNTTSYADAQRNLELAEKTLSAQWTVSGSQLSAVEKGLMDAEFKAYLRDRINSYRSNINNYEQNQGFAEVSLSLTSNPTPPSQIRHRRSPRTEEATQFEVIPAAPPATSAANLYLIGPAAVMLALIAFFLFRNRIRPNVGETHRPDPT